MNTKGQTRSYPNKIIGFAPQKVWFVGKSEVCKSYSALQVPGPVSPDRYSIREQAKRENRERENRDSKTSCSSPRSVFFDSFELNYIGLNPLMESEIDSSRK